MRTTRSAIPSGLPGSPTQRKRAGGWLGLLLVCAAAAAISVVLPVRPPPGWAPVNGSPGAATLMVLFMVLSDYLLPQSGVVDALYGFVVALVPVAAGIAVLRYRLYDIDRLINRTLVYGLLTALLGAGYAAAVLVLGQLAGWAPTHRAGRWPAPPWRWRRCSNRLGAAPQAVVDRRFNRSKHDAAKTIQACSTRLRDQIDLDTLSAELLAVVDQTMEPTRVSLWLRPPTTAPRIPVRDTAHSLGVLSTPSRTSGLRQPGRSREHLRAGNRHLTAAPTSVSAGSIRSVRSEVMCETKAR